MDVYLETRLQEDAEEEPILWTLLCVPMVMRSQPVKGD
jgi:hypothetical protein